MRRRVNWSIGSSLTSLDGARRPHGMIPVSAVEDAARRLENQSILVFSRGKFDDAPDHGERIAGGAVTQN